MQGWCNQASGAQVVLENSERLPEGVLYDYLHEMGVNGGLSEVYESGIVSEDALYYRIEYITMDDCGQAIRNHFVEQAKDGMDKDVFCRKLLGWLKQFISVIGNAYAHGVYRRDNYHEYDRWQK